MTPQEQELYLLTNRIIKLESELTDIQASLGILLANTKELSNKMITQKNPQSEIDILAQRILALEKVAPKVVMDKIILLENRVLKLEAPVRKNWWQE